MRSENRSLSIAVLNLSRRLSRLVAALLLIGCSALSAATLAQDKTVSISAPEPLAQRIRPPVAQMNDDEAKRFLTEALNLCLPDELNDDVYLLVKSRSRLALPELTSRLRSAESLSDAPAKFLHTVTDLIAYASDEAALEILLKMAVSNRERFGRYVGRSLDYAYGRGNPYSLAYRAISKAEPEAAIHIIDWVEQNLAAGQSQGDWAEAIVERDKGMPSDDALADDPIVSKLPGGAPDTLKRELSRMAGKTRAPERQ